VDRRVQLNVFRNGSCQASLKMDLPVDDLDGLKAALSSKVRRMAPGVLAGLTMWAGGSLAFPCNGSSTGLGASIWMWIPFATMTLCLLLPKRALSAQSPPLVRQRLAIPTMSAADVGLDRTFRSRPGSEHGVSSRGGGG